MIVRYLHEETDMPAILELEKESDFTISHMIENEDTEEEVGEPYNTWGYAFGVFDDTNKLVGFCSVGYADEFGTKYTNDICLSDLYVLEAERGKGYGKALIEKTIEKAKIEQVNILLDLWDDDLESLYVPYGFEKLFNYSMIWTN